jgi:hypothetical protein
MTTKHRLLSLDTSTLIARLQETDWQTEEKFDSDTEKHVLENNPQLKKLKARQEIFPIIVVKSTSPDFLLDGKVKLFIEAKGHPRKEWIEKITNMNKELKVYLRLILESHRRPYNKQTQTSLGAFLFKQGIPWITVGDKIPQCWILTTTGELPPSHRCSKCDGGMKLFGSVARVKE